MESMIILPVMVVGRGATMARLWLEAAVAGAGAVGAAVGTTLIAAVAARSVNAGARINTSAGLKGGTGTNPTAAVTRGKMIGGTRARMAIQGLFFILQRFMFPILFLRIYIYTLAKFQCL
jgi:hypothetical protein